MTTTGGEPTTRMGPGTTSPDVVVISPRRSPRHVATVQYSLASTGTDAPIPGTDKEVEKEHHGEGRSGADPLVTLLSSTAPESNSPARASIDEPVRTEDVPASGPAGSQAMTTKVAKEEPIPS